LLPKDEDRRTGMMPSLTRQAFLKTTADGFAGTMLPDSYSTRSRQSARRVVCDQSTAANPHKVREISKRVPTVSTTRRDSNSPTVAISTAYVIRKREYGYEEGSLRGAFGLYANISPRSQIVAEGSFICARKPILDRRSRQATAVERVSDLTLTSRQCFRRRMAV